MIPLGLSANAFAYEQNFTISAVGGSNNTNTVFIDVLETAKNTECINKKHFKLPLTDQHADRFFSMALAAQAQNKKMSLHYEPTDCINGAIKPRVFKIIK